MRNMTRNLICPLSSLGNNRKLIVLQFNASVNYDLIYSGKRDEGEKTKSLIPFKGYILVSSLAH